MDSWYYKISGTVYGPVTFDMLIELAKSRGLSANDDVRRGEKGLWLRAGLNVHLMAYVPSVVNFSSEPKVAANGSDGIPSQQIVAWYHKAFGNEFGPMTLDELIKLAKDHTLSPDDEVRFGINGAWRRAGSIGKLMAHMPSGAHVISANRAPQVAASYSFSASISEPSNAGESTEEISSDEKVGWYYKVFGDEFGPVSIDELIQMAKSQTLSREDEVRFGASGGWRRAGAIGKLMTHLPFETNTRPILDQTSSIAAKNRTSGSVAKRSAGTDVMSNSRSKSVVVDSAPRLDNQWWCSIQNKVYGPVELPKLIGWAASGRLRRLDLVRLGENAYVAAGDLPGLFPDLPPDLTAETKVEISTLSETSEMSVVSTPNERSAASQNNAGARSDANASSIASGNLTSNRPLASSPNAPVSPVQSAFSPSPTIGSAGMAARPRAPIQTRRSPSRGSSINFEKLVVPAMSVVGVALLGALVYFTLPILLQNKAADIKRLNELQTALIAVQEVRKMPSVKDEDFKSATTKLGAVTKTVETDLKGKTSDVHKKLLSLATNLKRISKQKELIKPVSAETSAERTITELKKLLGIS